MRLSVREIVLTRIDFHQSAGGKVRPAVVLLDTGDDDFVAAPVTSLPRVSEFDIAIHHLQDSGLNVPSWVRLHKLTVLPKDAVVRRLGFVTQPEREGLSAVLRRTFLF